MPVAATPASRPSATVRTNLSYLMPICLVATLGGLLFGYDTGVISGAIEFLTARFKLDVVMKGWASGCVLIGCATGVLIVGPISDRFGRKKALLLAAALFLVSAIGTALPRDIWTFIVFRWLGGIGIGIASMSTPMYIAEIAPAHLRGRLVSVNQIAIVGGILVVYFVNYFIARYGDQAWNETVGWRWMFASGILPSVAFALLLLGIPESPRWLVEMGRADQAKTILTKVAGEEFAQRRAGQHPRRALHRARQLGRVVLPRAAAAADRRHPPGHPPAGHRHQRLPLLRHHHLQEHERLHRRGCRHAPANRHWRRQRPVHRGRHRHASTSGGASP